MEFIEYIGSDGFVHYILHNSWGVPFELYLLLLVSCCIFIYLVLKRIIG